MSSTRIRKRRIVAVTGASAGLGRAIVRAFADAGWDVGLIARGRDGLEAARLEVEAAGGRALVLPGDVADADFVDDAADRIERELGPLDAWVNGAMVSVFSPVAQMAADEYRRVTEVTYLGTVHGTLSALRRMSARGRGTILQVGSALAYRSIPLQSAYCAAKHAVLGFTDSLRCELLHENSAIGVCVIQMPALNTPQFDWSRSRMPRRAQPVPPIYQPEVGAQAVLWAAEHEVRELNVGLSTSIAILGQRIAPSLGDHYLAATAFDSQMTDEPETPGRPDNLYHPLPGDAGAHGRFDARAAASSPYLWAMTHKGAVAVAAALGMGLVFTSLLASRAASGGAATRRLPEKDGER